MNRILSDVVSFGAIAGAAAFYGTRGACTGAVLVPAGCRTGGHFRPGLRGAAESRNNAYIRVNATL